MFNLEAVSAQRLYRLIADKITQKIRDGEFPVGSRLPGERDLAEVLGVSRSSVREALIALELSGYVEVRLGSGVYVTMPREGASLSANVGAEIAPAVPRPAMDIGPFELLEARLLIEPEVAARAAQNASNQQLAVIRETQEAMSAGGAPNQRDRAFHAAIAAACGNSALEAVVLSLRELSEASPVYQRLDKHFVGRKAWKAALVEHDRITNAILERDPIRARHEMYAHLLAIMARLREDFADNPSAISAPAKRKANSRKTHANAGGMSSATGVGGTHAP
ncbi:FadR/GntR family transcriptional regulator [Polaromonas jejuensis]|uniref:FadR/GntR family transcriptional regulator n=1 Tax=Polaromonas jejuensis TaxID=457502 RepID=A0ABW0QDA9_9BURK|nr:FadR/GntR family transcriptional regulator [Polaromonas jejuensis]